MHKPAQAIATLMASEASLCAEIEWMIELLIVTQ